MALIGAIFVDSHNINKELFLQNDNLILDNNRKRYIMCSCCGHVGDTSDFWCYGGVDTLNLGKCYICS